MCKTCSQLLQEYREADAPVYSVNRIPFGGVDGLDVYNITAPFRDGGDLVIAGRVEKRDSESSQIVFFVEKEGQWVPRSQSPVLELQDPFITFLHGKLVVGGVQTFPHPEIPNALGWRTTLYSGDCVNMLEPCFQGPDGMKDLRFVELHDGRIGVFTRPQGEKGGRGKIGFLIVDRLADLTVEMIQEADLIPDQFTEEEWGGTNEIHCLKDGSLGVLGHIACFDSEGNRHYYSMTFRFDYQTRTAAPIKLLAVRNEFLPSDPKRPDLYDVVFSGGLVGMSNGTAALYAGIGDADAQILVLDHPFC